MSKASKIILGVLVGLVIIMIIAEANQPEPLDWSSSYYRKDKIPKGSYIFFEQLSEVVRDLEITDQSPYSFLQDSTLTGTYFFLNRFYGSSVDEVNEVLKFARRGNRVFVASNHFGPALQDSLGFIQQINYNTNQLKNFPQFRLAHTFFPDSLYTFEHDERVMYFDSLESHKAKTLGYVKIKGAKASDTTLRPNFVKFQYGKGDILLHSNPEVFSNYFLLDGNNIQYLENLLAYIDLDGKIYWDAFHKAGKPTSAGLLYILTNNTYLKWSYYLLLISILLFIIFEGKRKQKKIPVIKPLVNKTFDYTRTVAGMYLDKKAHHIMVDKQVNQLMAFIRKRCGLSTENIDRSFIEELNGKVDLPKNEVEALFRTIDELQKKGQKVSQEELMTLNRKINAFKTKL